MAKHFKKTKNSKKVLLFLLILVLFFIVFFVIKFFSTEKSFTPNDIPKEKEEHKISTSDIHTFSNDFFLHSEDFSLTVSDGISTINATIVNNSEEIVEDLKCLYSLIDSSNNIVYSFDISINSIEPNNSSSFACMAILDLSNVVDYSVSLIEQ